LPAVHRELPDPLSLLLAGRLAGLPAAALLEASAQAPRVPAVQASAALVWLLAAALLLSSVALRRGERALLQLHVQDCRQGSDSEEDEWVLPTAGKQEAGAGAGELQGSLPASVAQAGSEDASVAVRTMGGHPALAPLAGLEHRGDAAQCASPAVHRPPPSPAASSADGGDSPPTAAASLHSLALATPLLRPPADVEPPITLAVSSAGDPARGAASKALAAGSPLPLLDVPVAPGTVAAKVAEMEARLRSPAARRALRYPALALASSSAQSPAVRHARLLDGLGSSAASRAAGPA
jgi:hypothetical protein